MTPSGQGIATRPTHDSTKGDGAYTAAVSDGRAQRLEPTAPPRETTPPPRNQQHTSIFSDIDARDSSVININSSDAETDSSGCETDDERELIRLAAIQNHPRLPRHKQDRQQNHRDPVIVGNGSSLYVRAAKRPLVTKQRKCIGLFIGRVSRSYKAHHINQHIFKEANMRVRCEEIPSKYQQPKTRYFLVRLNPRDQKKLMHAHLWPAGTIVRGYTE